MYADMVAASCSRRRPQGKTADPISGVESLCMMSLKQSWILGLSWPGRVAGVDPRGIPARL